MRKPVRKKRSPRTEAELVAEHQKLLQKKVAAGDAKLQALAAELERDGLTLRVVPQIVVVPLPPRGQ